MEEAQTVEIEGKERAVNSNIEYTFFFGEHRTAEDGKQFSQHLEATDIFVPEVMGWDGKTFDRYRLVSEGKLSPEKALQMGGGSFRAYEEELLHALSNSHKTIVLADLPNGHPLVNRVGLSNSEYAKSPRLNLDFQDMLNKKRQWAETNVKDQWEREEYILANLPHLIQKEFDSNPLLKDKPHLKVLIFLGAYHTKVLHEAKKIYNGKVSSIFASSDFRYSLNYEITRRIAFQQNVDDVLLARSVVEQQVSLIDEGFIKPNYTDLLKRTAYYRYVAESFSIDEIRDMYVSSNGSGLRLRMNLLKVLKEKGLEYTGATKESIDRSIAKA